MRVQDFKQIFSVVPNVQKLCLRNAGQFKDDVLGYMSEKAPNIHWLSLYGCNLVTNQAWIHFFARRGAKLSAIKLQWLDAAFDDDAVSAMVESCANLRRLKIKRCRRVGAPSIDHIASIRSLEHLSLQVAQDVPTERIVNLIGSLGPSLRTLSLECFFEANDSVLAAIHSQCRLLSKLRLTENDYCTDAGFTTLFTDWANLPLTFVDLNSTRDVDNSNPDGPANPTGLASEGFKALMAHSGPALEHLKISSCRHISKAAFWDVFDGSTIYPALQTMDVSFCGSVGSETVNGIFASCPNLKKVIAFGCFDIGDVKVPKGVALIGVPRAQDAMEQYGDEVVVRDGDLKVVEHKDNARATVA